MAWDPVMWNRYEREHNGIQLIDRSKAPGLHNDMMGLRGVHNGMLHPPVEQPTLKRCDRATGRV